MADELEGQEVPAPVPSRLVLALKGLAADNRVRVAAAALAMAVLAYFGLVN